MLGLIVLGFAMAFVVEGFFLLAFPGAWRDAMKRAGEMTDGQLRFMGLAAMAAGLVLLPFLR